MSLTVILIDDDQEETELFNEALLKIDQSFKLTWYSVSAAFDAIIHDPPSIVFLDLNIPKVSGKDLLKMLRANGKTIDLPVVIYSTSISQKDIEDTAPYNVKAFLQKPENFPTLCKKIAEVIQRKDPYS